jgi:hypothetical protein
MLSLLPVISREQFKDFLQSIELDSGRALVDRLPFFSTSITKASSSSVGSKRSKLVTLKFGRVLERG